MGCTDHSAASRCDTPPAPIRQPQPIAVGYAIRLLTRLGAGNHSWNDRGVTALKQNVLRESPTTRYIRVMKMDSLLAAILPAEDDDIVDGGERRRAAGEGNRL